MLQRYSYDQKERTSANSEYEQRDRSDSGALRKPVSDCEQSSKDTRYRAPEKRDRSNNRSGERSPPKQPERGREESTEERALLRRGRHVAEKLASLPNQRIRHPDHQYKGVSHPRLPIRSLSENCTAAEQHQRWIDDSPTRSTEILPDINRWINHLRAAGPNPIHLVTLSPESLDVTRWWFEFLVEVEAIDGRDHVFRDLTRH